MELNEARLLIDNIDEMLVYLLKMRNDNIKEVGKIKKRENLEIIQKDRIFQKLRMVEALAIRHGINPETIRKVFEILIEEAHEIEASIVV